MATAHDLFKAVDAENSRQVPIPGSRHRRTYLGTELAVCAGSHLQELFFTIVFIGHAV
jgi:hypothetical protein